MTAALPDGLPLAVALEAAVFGARSARLNEPAVEGLAGPVQPDHGVVGRDVLGLGDLLDGSAIHLDLLENVGVLALEGRDDVLHALADGFLQLRVFRR